MKQRIRHVCYLIILVALDQVSKYWASTILKENGPMDIIPGVFQLQYSENSGAVWGIMQGRAVGLSIFTIIVLMVLVIMYLKIPQDRKYNAIKLLFVFIGAGAIGNMIDRISLNYVVDFLYFSLINFPIFNIADSYITVACIVFFLLTVFYYKEEDALFADWTWKKKGQNEKES